jgi:hypothetical protein
MAGLDGCGKTRPPPEFDSRTVQPSASRCTDWAILSSCSVQSQSWPCGRNTGIWGRWNKLQTTTTLPTENVPLGFHWIGVYLDTPIVDLNTLEVTKIFGPVGMEPWFLGFGGGAQSLRHQKIPSPPGSVFQRNVLYSARRLWQAPLQCSVPSQLSRLNYRHDSWTVVVDFPTEATESSPNWLYRLWGVWRSFRVYNATAAWKFPLTTIYCCGEEWVELYYSPDAFMAWVRRFWLWLLLFVP